MPTERDRPSMRPDRTGDAFIFGVVCVLVALIMASAGALCHAGML